MRVLVLGGYGLIGTAITKGLLKSGHEVTGLGRSAVKGKALIPAADWMGADISKLTQLDHWMTYLENIDIVVNASGALQNGLSDNVAAVQQDSMLALFKACEAADIQHVIQISAPDAREDSSTLFFRTKAAADIALKNSVLNWTIFRPGLVISPHAYGGTSLLRTLAAFPWVQPLVLANTPIQTVYIDDVVSAVGLAIDKKIYGADVDLVETSPQSLAELTLGFRRWLGFKPPKAVIKLPEGLGRAAARLADIGGWLGWRSALRTTSLDVLRSGVRGDPEPWAQISKRDNLSLSQIFDQIPSTLQERIYARAMLLFPVLLLVLSLFWITSGVIGLINRDAAALVLDGAMPPELAAAFVGAGSIADILIGGALLIRPLTRIACGASIALSVAYLSASAVLTPALWADPLGSMVKVFPAIALALIVAALAQER